MPEISGVDLRTAGQCRVGCCRRLPYFPEMEVSNMRKWLYLLPLVLLLTPEFLLATPKSYKKTLTLSDEVQLGNMNLAPGRYKVVWEQMGNKVPVSIVKNGKTIETVRAKVLSQKNPYNGTAVDMTRQVNGAPKLKEIEFSKVAVIFNQNPVVNNR